MKSYKFYWLVGNPWIRCADSDWQQSHIRSLLNCLYLPFLQGVKDSDLLFDLKEIYFWKK